MTDRPHRPTTRRRPRLFGAFGRFQPGGFQLLAFFGELAEFRIELGQPFVVGGVRGQLVVEFRLLLAEFAELPLDPVELLLRRPSRRSSTVRRKGFHRRTGDRIRGRI